MKIAPFLLSATAYATSLGFTPTPSSCGNSNWWTVYGCEASAGSTFGNGWTVTTGSVDFVPDTWWPSDPTKIVVDLSGDQPGSISNTLFLPWGSYDLTFKYSYNPDNSMASREATVSMSGVVNWTSTLGPLSNDTNALYGPLNSGTVWLDFHKSFYTYGGPVTLDFSSLTDCYQGITIADDVDISRVPEPSSMLLTGMGLLVVYRRIRCS